MSEPTDVDAFLNEGILYWQRTSRGEVQPVIQPVKRGDLPPADVRDPRPCRDCRHPRSDHLGWRRYDEAGLTGVAGPCRRCYCPNWVPVRGGG